MNYRQDIDGLRAIAVLVVVLFHLGVPGLDGGYVGVDVFFVISGYLITSLIQQRLTSNSFRLSDFYLRRLRRLYPPLLVTVAFTLLASAFVLTPVDMIGLARSAVAALFSAANISFYLEAGYWDSASELKPLLHTWSLGIEEQFYLFWPAVLILLFRLREFVSFTASMSVFVLLGFAACFWITRVDQPAAFFLLPFRVFEFALGATLIPLGRFCASAPRFAQPSVSSLLLLTGLVLIIASVVSLGGGAQFPGWVVLLPSIGAALCLLSGFGAQPPNTSLSVMLGNPVSLWMGRVSYSMYLAHWPIITLYRYEHGIALDLADQLFLAVLIVGATCALHYGVEKRLYTRAGYVTAKRPLRGNKAVVGGVFTSLIALALLSSSAWLIDGWAWRYPQLQFSSEQIQQAQQARLRPADMACRVGYAVDHPLCDNRRRVRLLIIGNSHEVDGYNIASVMLSGRDDVELILFGNMNSCGDVARSGTRLTSRDGDCQKRLDAVFSEDFSNRLSGVIYSSNRPFAMNKAPALSVLTAIKERRPDVEVLSFGGYLNTERRCVFYINRTGSSSGCAQADNVTYFADDSSNDPLYDGFMGVTDRFVDLVDVLCTDRVLESCLTMTRDRVPAFYDESHLSLEFAQMLGRMIHERTPGLSTWLE